MYQFSAKKKNRPQKHGQYEERKDSMKKVIAILLCMGVIMSFAGCDSSIVEELNPFEQITSEKESKFETT